MSYFTIFKRSRLANGVEAWVLIAGTVEAEDPDAALEQVLDTTMGAGGYMLVEVKALREVKAKTTFSVEPMDPPEAIMMSGDELAELEGLDEEET